MSSWGPGPARRVAWVDADPRIQVNRVARMRACIIIYWIATVALLPHDDKRLSVLAYRTFITHGMTKRERGAQATG